MTSFQHFELRVFSTYFISTDLNSDDAAAGHVSDHVVLPHRLKVGLLKHYNFKINSHLKRKNIQNFKLRTLGISSFKQTWNFKLIEV